MSRIYEGGSADNRYREANVGRQYQAVKAVSSDKQINEWKKRRSEEGQTASRALEREIRLDNMELTAQQKADVAHMQTQNLMDRNALQADQLYESNTMKLQHFHEGKQMALDLAELQAQHRVQNANFQATRTAISGILNLAGAGLKYASHLAEVEAEEAEIDETIAQSNWLFGDVGDVASAETAQIQTEIAEETAVSGLDMDPVQGETLRRDMGYEQTHIRNLTSRSVGEAAMTFDGDFQSAWYDPETRVNVPGLGVVRPSEVPLEFVQPAAIALAKEITKGYGVGTGGRDNLHAAATQYAPQVRNSISRLTSTVRSQLVTAGQANREFDGYSSAEVYRTNTGDIQGSWLRFYAAAMENAKGNKVKATENALSAYVQNASESELRALQGVRVFEGGPTFGNDKRYNEMLESAIHKREVQGVQRYNTQASVRKQEVSNATNAFTAALALATTPEQTQAAHDSYERALQALSDKGNIEATKELLEQKSIDRPNAYNPRNAAVIQERVQAGEVMTQEFLDQELRLGRINQKEHTFLSKGAVTTVQNKHNTYGGKDQYNASNSLVQSRLTDALSDDLGLLDASQVREATARMKVDIIQRRDAAVAQFVRNSGGEASPAEVQQFADAWIDKNVPALLKGVQVDSETGAITGYTRMGASTLAPASAANGYQGLPQYSNAYTGKPATDFSSLSPAALQTYQLNHRIDAANSRVLTTQERNAAIKAYSEGNPIPASVVRKANALGMDEYELTRQQAASAGFKLGAVPTAVIPKETAPPTSTPRSSVEQRALDVIGKYESDGVGSYNAVNQIGIAGGRGTLGHSGDIRQMPQHGGKAVTEMTVGEIMELQAPRPGMSNEQWIAEGRLHAVGRYQFIGPTFRGVVQRMGIDPNTKFTPAIQDAMALDLLRSGGLSQWIGPDDHATSTERTHVQEAIRILRNPGSSSAQLRRAAMRLS